MGMPRGVVTVQQVEMMWQGQFPPPDAIERYEATLPGTFNRLIAMAEKRMDAEIEGSRHHRTTRANDTRRGHYLGAIVTFGAVIGAGLCAYIHQPWVAVTFLAVPVMSVAHRLIGDHRQSPPLIAQPTAANTPSKSEKPDEQEPQQ